MNPEGEEIKPPVITEPTKTVDSEVVSSVLSSWNGDVGGYSKVVSVVGGVFGLFRIENGRITNQESIEAQIMDGIASSGRNNPNYKDILGKLASPVEQTVRKQYEEMAKLRDSEGQSAILSNEINKVLGDYGLVGYADVLAPDVRGVVLEKLGKDAEVPKPVTEKTSRPAQQQEEDKDKDKEEKEDSKSKKEEKVEEGKDPNEKLENKGQNEFEEDIRNAKKKEGEAENGEESGEKKPHDPKDIENRNQNKQLNSENTPEAKEGENLDKSSQGESNQQKPSESSSEDSSDQTNQGQGDGKSSTSTKDRTPEKNQGQNQSNSSQPNQPSQGNTGSDVPSSGNQPPGNSTPKGTTSGAKPGNTGTPSPEIPSSSVPTSRNLAPGKGGIDGGGGIKRLSSDKLSGAKPSFPSDGPLQIPKITPLKNTQSGAKIPGGGSILPDKFKKIKQIGAIKDPVGAAKQYAKDAAGEAAKKAAQQTAKATAKLASQVAQAGLRLAGSAIQAIAAFLAPLAPVIAIIALIIALILGILFIIVAFACPGINTFAQKSSEIVGADKLAFNDKLDERCRSENKNPCGPGSGNVSNTDFGSGDGKITDRECAKAKELWPLFQKAGAEFGVDPYILAGIAQRESNMTFGLSPSGTCAGKGDSGFGHGLMQIDSRSHQAYLSEGTWVDCQDNIDYAASLMKSIQTRWPDVGLRQQLNAYNAGSPCKSGTDSCTTKSYGTGTLVDIANVKNCLTGINLPTPSQNTAQLDNSNSQNFLAFNPFGSVEVRAQSSKYDWIADGGSFDGISLKENGRFTRSDTGSGGIDITIAEPGKPYEQSRNTPVVSHLPGTITFVTTGQDNAKSGYGNQVGIYYPSTNTTAVFSHLETVNVTAGQSVSPGSLMGRQGSTGSTRGGDDGTGKGFVHIDLRLFDGKITADSGGSINGLDNRYNTFVNSWLDYYAANSAKIIASNFSPTATLASNTSSVPCTPESSTGVNGAGVINAKGSLTLLEAARRGSAGKKPDGRCWYWVAEYIVESGGFGNVTGAVNMPYVEASAGTESGASAAFNTGAYWNQNLSSVGLVNLLDSNPNANPYNAPAGSIVVVAYGYWGAGETSTDGDIAVADGNGKFYNGGEMKYPPASDWNGSYSKYGTGPGTPLIGSGKLIGIYVPATGVNALPKQSV